MGKKRCLPNSFHSESPKKRLRRRHLSDDDDDEEEDSARTLKIARKELRATEKENIQLRVEKVNKTAKKIVQCLGRAIRQSNQLVGQRIINKSVHIRFPLNYNDWLKFIDGYTGVKKRSEATISWDEKESKNWLNRQRATVYGPTLFKDVLDFIAQISKEISEEDPLHSRRLCRLATLKLLSELLRVNYKPKSKQAAAKRLICANSIKHKVFRRRLIELVGRQDITKGTTLESVADRAEKEYETLLGSYNAQGDAMSADEAEELSADDHDEEELDDEDEDKDMENDQHFKFDACTDDEGVDKMTATTNSSQSNSPQIVLRPSFLNAAMNSMGPFVPPPVSSLDTSTMPSLLPSVIQPARWGENSASPAARISQLQQEVSALKSRLIREKSRSESLKRRADRAERLLLRVPPEFRRPLDEPMNTPMQMTQRATGNSLPLPLPPFADLMSTFGGSYGSYVPANFDSDLLSTMSLETAVDASTEHSAFESEI